MRIMITGARGMVGRNVVNHSGLAGYELLTPNRKELNLCDAQAVLDYISKASPDIIIHCAGKVGGIQANINDPVAFLCENMDMGRNVVLAAQQAGVKKLINLGSSCMYPRAVDGTLKEEYILTGELEPTNEGYALAKIMVARLCRYISEQNVSYCYKTLIPCNIYGSWDVFDPNRSHMIPAVIRKIHEAKESGAREVEIWGDGTARREFLYAADLADCIVRASLHIESLPDMMNVGIGKDLDINGYYKLVAEVVGYTGTFTHDLSKPVGMKNKLVDTSRATAWGWQAQTDWREGLAQTYQFFCETYGDKRA